MNVPNLLHKATPFDSLKNYVVSFRLTSLITVTMAITAAIVVACAGGGASWSVIASRVALVDGSTRKAAGGYV